MSPQAQLTGLYPRSEQLIELTRAYDRGQAGWPEVGKLLDLESRHVIGLQEDSGFEYINDGALFWQDPLRPLSQSLQGLETGTRYSRWFDTNTFYQKPTVTGKVSLRPINPESFIRADLLPRSKKWKVSLPGPYTFSELSENRHYRSREDLVLSIANEERELITRLAKAGVSLVQLSEPCLVYRPYREEPLSSRELENAVSAIKVATEDSPVKVSVQTFFGDASPVLPKLLELPVQVVGFDLYETDYSKLQAETSKQIALGIVDSRESHVESPEWIAHTVGLVRKQVKASDWILSPNSDLKYLPQTVADAKARALGGAVALLEEAN
jgi:5-methyltetrahydropteroyltriglutamate--homocysteine methyltransferase